MSLLFLYDLIGQIESLGYGQGESVGLIGIGALKHIAVEPEMKGKTIDWQNNYII